MFWSWVGVEAVELRLQSDAPLLASGGLGM